MRQINRSTQNPVFQRIPARGCFAFLGPRPSRAFGVGSIRLKLPFRDWMLDWRGAVPLVRIGVGLSRVNHPSQFSFVLTGETHWKSIWLVGENEDGPANSATEWNIALR